MIECADKDCEMIDADDELSEEDKMHHKNMVLRHKNEWTEIRDMFMIYKDKPGVLMETYNWHCNGGVVQESYAKNVSLQNFGQFLGKEKWRNEFVTYMATIKNDSEDTNIQMLIQVIKDYFSYCDRG